RWADMAGDDTVHLRGPMRIGVVAQDARPRAPADRLGLDRIKPYEDFGNVLPVARHENLFPFLQEELYACPGIGNQAGSGTRSLEDARRGGKTVLGHAGAIDVEHRLGRGVEGVVIAGRDMAHVAHVLAPRLVVPTRAA